MTRVILKQSSYDYTTLKQQCFEIMDALGGDLIERHSHVIVKPNFLIPAAAETAILTHPTVVRAAVEYVLEKGAHVQVSDSPAIGSFDKILKESGVGRALEGLDVKCVPFKTSLSVDIGEPFGRIDIAADAVEADFVINLPKLKTHNLMLLTLGVKNLFGCIVDFRKPEWHLKMGLNRDMFARLIVQIHRAVKPFMTILDGILALEGDGPGKGGIPKHVGLLMGSNNAAALDITVCRLLGIEPDLVPTNKIARGMGMVNTFHVEGEFPPIRDFRLPDAGPAPMGPEFLHGMLRRYLLPRPDPDQELCTMCGRCLQFCPASAITGDSEIRFDYEKCIRCYCCIEVCPHGALKTVESWPGKVLRRILGKSI
ncbi:MAG: DUF362 domain-containing protein [Syntrophales bacterium]